MTRGRARVWFNKGFSMTYDAIRIIRDADRDGRLELFASHDRAEVPALAIANRGWIEPRPTLDDEEYVQWCLDRCYEHDVRLLVAQRRQAALSAARARFEAAGTRVLAVASPETLELLDRKDSQYADLQGTGVTLPEFRVVQTLDEFDAAYAELRARHARLCVKPVRGVNGLGFLELLEGGGDFQRIMTGDYFSMSLDAYRRALAAADSPPPLMVMQFLPDEERSVDCLAQDGQLLVALARVKRSDFQEFEDRGEAVEMARLLTKRYRLNGMFNVQTRNANGRPYFLEVNARMSGGMQYSCLSGVAIPFWAVTLALGMSSPAEIPAPDLGIRVAPVATSIALPRRPGTRRSSTARAVA